MLDLASDDEEDEMKGWEKLMDKLIRNVETSAEAVKALQESDVKMLKALDKFHDAIWKITGLIVILETNKKVARNTKYSHHNITKYFPPKVAVPRKLWFTIASAPVVLFRAEVSREISKIFSPQFSLKYFLQVMLDVVECWHWLLSACPSQELVFLQVETDPLQLTECQHQLSHKVIKN